MRTDERRSAGLLFHTELQRGEVSMEQLEHREVRRAVRHRGVPAKALRIQDALALRHDRWLYERELLGRMAGARRAVLGARGAGPPRLLVRMDEFPHARAYDFPHRYGTDVFRRFHDVMSRAGVRYLLAVLPRPAHAYLDPTAEGDRPLSDEERTALEDAFSGGAEPGLHGLTHRTREALPSRHSELAGLAAPELSALLERGMGELAGAGLPLPRVIVPPFNRFDPSQYAALAKHFDVICGGPETVLLMGLHRTPLFRGEAVYVPSYPPLYGIAEEIEPALRRVIAMQPGTWVPVTLHMGWEADRGWTALERLARTMAPYACSWSELIEAASAATTRS